MYSLSVIYMYFVVLSANHRQQDKQSWCTDGSAAAQYSIAVTNT